MMEHGHDGSLTYGSWTLEPIYEVNFNIFDGVGILSLDPQDLMVMIIHIRIIETLNVDVTIEESLGTLTFEGLWVENQI